MNEPSRPDARGRRPGDGPQEIRAELQRREQALDGLLGRFTALSGRLDGLRGTTDALSSDVVSLKSATTDLRKDLSTTDSKLDALAADFTALRVRYERDQAVLAAQFDLDRTADEWRRRFGEREKVRSMAAGLIRSITPNLVGRGLLRTATVRSTLESHLVHDPDFWLGHATLAMAAQLHGDEELRLSAAGEALRLGGGKAYLFFALAAARAGEHEWAGNWTDRYLQAMDPDHLGGDFLVVLDAVASGELGEQAHGYAYGALRRWAAEAAVGTTAARAGARRWEPRLKKLLITPGDRYAPLGQACGGGWKELQEGWRLATVTTAALDHLRATFPPPEPGTGTATGIPYAETAIDRLIWQPDPDEAAVRARMDALLRFIDHRGDERATEEEPGHVADAEVMDLATLLDRAVFQPGQVALGEDARRLALLGVLPHLRAAAEAFVRAAGLRRKESVPVVIEGWRTVLPTDPAAPVDGTALASELAAAMRDRTEEEARAVVPDRIRRAGGTTGGLAVLVLAPFFLAGAFLWPVLLLGAVAVTWGLLDVRRVPAARRRVREAGLARNVSAQDQLLAVLGARVEFFADWDGHTVRLEELRRWTPDDRVRA
ncbi:hypothetical protein [Streptomyces sp. NPDC127112]|uniref:hypothetical protein n=1 Tax=Streptomyces sp. NPDC127112 TaxID=3345364 RepID=UPI00362E0C70